MRKIVLPLVVLVGCWFAANFILVDNQGSQTRLFNDDVDRLSYYEKGHAISSGQTPYRDFASEYPQVSTYLFYVPFLIRAGIDAHQFNVIFSGLMAAFALGSIVLLGNLLGNGRRKALLLLLPACLYFTFNRFDVIPCFVGLAALWLLARNRLSLSGFALGVGFLTKWYLALLLPIFLVYAARSNRKAAWWMCGVFLVTVAAILLPTFVAGGLDALLSPYLFHLNRPMNQESLPYLLNILFERFFQVDFSRSSAMLVFLVLQFSMVPVCIGAKIDSIEKVMKWSALTVLVFLLFAKFYSPQWILWVAPLLILATRGWWAVASLIALDVATYLYFPVVYDLIWPRGAASAAGYALFMSLVVVKTLLLIRFVVPLVVELLSQRTVSLTKGKTTG